MNIRHSISDALSRSQYELVNTATRQASKESSPGSRMLAKETSPVYLYDTILYDTISTIALAFASCLLPFASCLSPLTHFLSHCTCDNLRAALSGTGPIFSSRLSLLSSSRKERKGKKGQLTRSTRRGSLEQPRHLTAFAYQDGMFVIRLLFMPSGAFFYSKLSCFNIFEANSFLSPTRYPRR